MSITRWQKNEFYLRRRRRWSRAIVTNEALSRHDRMEPGSDGSKCGGFSRGRKKQIEKTNNIL